MRRTRHRDPETDLDRDERSAHGSRSPATSPGRLELLTQLQATGGNQMMVRLLASGRSARGEAGDELAERIRARLGLGDALPGDVRTQAQAGLGQRLGDVRLHRDTESGALARELGADAFTTGQDI